MTSSLDHQVHLLKLVRNSFDLSIGEGLHRIILNPDQYEDFEVYYKEGLNRGEIKEKCGLSDEGYTRYVCYYQGVRILTAMRNYLGNDQKPLEVLACVRDYGIYSTRKMVKRPMKGQFDSMLLNLIELAKRHYSENGNQQEYFKSWKTKIDTLCFKETRPQIKNDRSFPNLKIRVKKKNQRLKPRTHLVLKTTLPSNFLGRHLERS